MARGQGVKKLSSLFEKYRNVLIAPERSVITAFQEVVKDLYNWDIPDNFVSYSPKTKTLSVRASGPLRSEIAIHKAEILAHIKGRLGERSAPKNIL